MCVCVPVERVSLIAANGQHCHLAADKTVNVNVTVTNGATVAQLPFCPLAGRGSGLAADGQGGEGARHHVHLAQLSFIATLNDTPSVSVAARPPSLLAT